MNKVHASILSYLRENEAQDDALRVMFAGKNDNQIIRMMFSNFRGTDQTARGLCLTNLGLQIMKSYFKAYEIKRDKKKISSLEIVYLDNKAQLPYYIEQSGTLVMFDPDLGVKLKLADGDISILMDIDAVSSS